MLNAFITIRFKSTHGYLGSCMENREVVLPYMLLELLDYSRLPNLMESDTLYQLTFDYQIKSSTALTPGILKKVLTKDTSERFDVCLLSILSLWI